MSSPSRFPRGIAAVLVACLTATLLRFAAAGDHMTITVNWRPAAGLAQQVEVRPHEEVKFSWTGAHSLWYGGGRQGKRKGGCARMGKRTARAHVSVCECVCACDRECIV